MKNQLNVTDLNLTLGYPKLVVTFKTNNSQDKLFKKLFDALKTDYISFKNIKKGFENGIHFYYKKNEYDLEMLRFSQESMFLIVRSNNEKFQDKFLEVLVRYSVYIGNKKELTNLWRK